MMGTVTNLRRSDAVVKVVLPDGSRLSFGVDETDEDSVCRARARWKELKAEGASLTYWRRQLDGKLQRIG